jgi:cytochrome c2
MAPVRFEDHCHRCHKLTYEIDDPEREVPHGNVPRVRDSLEAYYGLRTLERADIDPAEPDVLTRRRPGRQAGVAERAEGLASAAKRAQQAGQELFEYRACATCHKVEEQAGSVFGWDVVPVRVARTWFPKARFDHGRHATVPCEDCHKAADSEKSDDVLVKGIASCRECHGEPGAGERVQSTCISCHGFHVAQGSAMDGHARPKPGDRPAPRPAQALPAPTDLEDQTRPEGP